MWKDWEIIDALGERAGASECSRKKWRQRRTVPPKWRLLIADVVRELAFDAPPDFELRKWIKRQDVRA